jgi:hypothetical protein
MVSKQNMQKNLELLMNKGVCQMKHGVKFVEEHPKYADVLKKIYKTRELDEWYKGVCKSELIIPKELKSIEEINRLNILERNWPSISVDLQLNDETGEGGLVILQIIQLRISKIIPVYDVNYFYSIKHNGISGALDLWGPPQTDNLITIDKKLSKVMEENDYLELSQLYDLHDTVYEWKELTNIDRVNRRLTLEDAVFVDILELCNE